MKGLELFKLLSIFVILGLSYVPESAEIVDPIPVEKFGCLIFFTNPCDSYRVSEIVTPGIRHIEICKETQTLRAFDEKGEVVLQCLVSTGKKGKDSKGRKSHETLPGFFKVLKIYSQKRWKEDHKIIMINAIQIDYNEKYIHSLPRRTFNFESRLGKKDSHGCIRISNENSCFLKDWLEERDYYKRYPVVVYIYEKEGSRL